MLQLKGLEFETERLRLLRVQQSDAAFMVALLNSEGWLRFIGERNVKTIPQAETYIEQLAEIKTGVYWKAERKTDGVSLGVVTLLKREYLEYMDIGFAFLPEHGKQGYALEGSKKVMEEVFARTEAAFLLGMTKPENVTSVKLLERLGLVFEQPKKVGEETLSLYAVHRREYIND